MQVEVEILKDFFVEKVKLFWWRPNFHTPFKLKLIGHIQSYNSAAIPLCQSHRQPHRNWMSDRSKTHRNRHKAQMQMIDLTHVPSLPTLSSCFGFASAVAVFLLEQYQLLFKAGTTACHHQRPGNIQKCAINTLLCHIKDIFLDGKGSSLLIPSKLTIPV